jgi:hypothetical protein
MKRKWNWSLWTGFIFVLAGFLTYTFFVQFPITRDFPWANFLLFGIGGIFLVVGLRHAFRQPQLYRGKVFGPILAALGALVLGFFCFIFFYELRQLPASTGAPRVGQKAPEFVLPDQDDKLIALADLVSSANGKGKSGGALLIFYRGFW